jgi:hypothetical protein
MAAEPVESRPKIPGSPEEYMMAIRSESSRWLARAAVVAAIAVARLSSAGAVDQKQFNLFADPSVVRCLAAFPDDPSRPPSASVTVKRGKLNDRLNITLRNIKPGLAFDMFTVEHSKFLADGTVDPAFLARNKSFGLAWYQSDLEVTSNLSNVTTIQTILVDQTFGFDPVVGLDPTNTFHIGFWFNDPQVPFDLGCEPGAVTPTVTPFNGEHHAGPLAMISLPDETTSLGPLCLNPDLSSNPVHCNP